MVGELIPDFGQNIPGLVGHVAVWSAVLASFIAMGLTAAGEIYNRRTFSALSYRAFLMQVRELEP